MVYSGDRGGIVGWHVCDQIGGGGQGGTNVRLPGVRLYHHPPSGHVGRRQTSTSPHPQLLVRDLADDSIIRWTHYIGFRGLKYVAKHRKQRIAAIASVLASSDYDIIALQELWVFADYEHVRDSVVSRLPYSKFFYR